MDSSKIQEDDIKSKHSKKGGDVDESRNQSKSGDGSGSEDGGDGEEEEILISDLEMKKLKSTF